MKEWGAGSSRMRDPVPYVRTQEVFSNHFFDRGEEEDGQEKRKGGRQENRGSLHP